MSVYLTLGPMLPLLVEKTMFWLMLGGVILHLLASAPAAIDSLARNIRTYSGADFPKGPGPRGMRVGVVAGQNLGDRFPAFDNWDPEGKEATQIFSTEKVGSPAEFASAVRSKMQQWQRVYDSRDVFSGLDAEGNAIEFAKEDIEVKNFLIVTPRISSSLTQFAAQLEQLEQEFGVDQIVVQESEAFIP